MKLKSDRKGSLLCIEVGDYSDFLKSRQQYGREMVASKRQEVNAARQSGRDHVLHAMNRIPIFH